MTKRELEKENEALRILLNWAEECDFGYDNFESAFESAFEEEGFEEGEFERILDEIENSEMDYIEGMIYAAEIYVEKRGNPYAKD